NVVKRRIKFPLGCFARINRLDFITLSSKGNVQHLADGALVIADQDVRHVRLPRAFSARKPDWRPMMPQHRLPAPSLSCSPAPCLAQLPASGETQTRIPVPAWNAPRLYLR